LYLISQPAQNASIVPAQRSEAWTFTNHHFFSRLPFLFTAPIAKLSRLVCELDVQVNDKAVDAGVLDQDPKIVSIRAEMADLTLWCNGAK
jgi:hypothetical protein